MERKSSDESTATGTVERGEPEVVTEFQSALDAVQGVCHRVTSDAGAAEVVQAIITDLGARRVVRSDDELVIDVLERVVGGFELLDPDQNRNAILESDLGVSRATLGVSEHGTIVMTSGDAAGIRGPRTERQRLVSLLPETHVARHRTLCARGTSRSRISAGTQNVFRRRSPSRPDRAEPPTSSSSWCSASMARGTSTSWCSSTGDHQDRSVAHEPPETIEHPRRAELVWISSEKPLKIADRHAHIAFEFQGVRDPPNHF